MRCGPSKDPRAPHRSRVRGGSLHGGRGSSGEVGEDGVLDQPLVISSAARSPIATAVHLAGTARMGPDSDPGAVVDQHLRVRGIEGLRVVDTSVMPTVTSRGPAATAVAIGERAAELLLSE